MVEKSWVQRHGVTPVKGALIAVLAIVLVAVLMMQFTGGSDSTGPKLAKSSAKSKRRGPVTSRTKQDLPTRSPAKPGSKARTALPTRVSSTPAVARPPRSSRNSWSKASLQNALEYNPLEGLGDLVLEGAADSSTAEADQPSDEQQVDSEVDEESVAKKRLVAWQQLTGKGVSMVVVGANGRSAFVGEQLVREGDVVDGFVVESIGPEGVRFAEPHGKK